MSQEQFPTTQDDAAEYWNQQAASFDDAPDHGLRDPAVHAAWVALLSPLLPPAPALIGDLGCGTGSLAVLLASLGHRVRALDIAPAMVELARAKAGGARVQVDVAVGDATTPPWPAADFDVIVCRHLLWALEDPAAALERWIRLLRPSGRLLLIEGRWSTGAGMSADAVVDLLTAGGRSAHVMPLRDRALWGREIADERFLVQSRGAV